MTGRINDNAIVKLTQISKPNENGTVVHNLDKIDIGKILANYSNSISGSKPQQVNIVSKEKYNYNGVDGILVKLDNGSLIFQAKKQEKKQDIVYQYHFKNENTLKNKCPSAMVLNPGDKTKQLTTKYEYYRNNNIKNKEVRDAKNTVIKQEHYNKNGKLENRKIYDKSGQLLKEIAYKYNKDNSMDLSAYDKNHKLEYTSHTEYKPDGKTAISSVSHYPDGKLRGEAKYDDRGKIQNSTLYYENGQLKNKTEYWDNGVIKEQEQYDETGKLTKTISAKIDGKFGESRQISEGDCYLMAQLIVSANWITGKQC